MPDIAALVNRLQKTPSYSASQLGARIYRVDKPNEVSDAHVFLVDEGSRDLIVAALRAYGAPA